MRERTRTHKGRSIIAMKAAIYVRLSKEDRLGAKSGIESCVVQRANAERAIHAQNWCTDGDSLFVDDDFSGAEIKRRPNLQALLEAAKQGAFDVLVVRDLDRLARDAARQTALLVQLQDAGVEVWSYTKRAFVQLEGSGYLMTTMEGIFAENERTKLAERVREGIRFRVRSGRRVTRAPLGYRNVRDANHAAVWEIDPDGAAVIVRAGETFVERGGSFHGTAVALNQAKTPSPGGSTWSPQMVKDVLQNPIYRGEYRHGVHRCVPRRGTIVRERAPEAEILRIPHPSCGSGRRSSCRRSTPRSRSLESARGARWARGTLGHRSSGAASAVQASWSRGPRSGTTFRTSATSTACTAGRLAAASATEPSTPSTGPCSRP
jgi:DNA invertase Pin-like site-specific DNA recombinase